MSGKHKYVPVGKSAADLRAQEEAFRDASQLITRCAFCDWTYTGTALEGRELAKGHRRVHHPEAKPAKRKRGSLQRFGRKQSDWRLEGLANAKEVAEMLAKRDGRAA